MLCHPGVAAPVAHGLALQRATELCYGTSNLADELARRMVMFQNADGSFGNFRCAPDGLRLAATAVVVRGWLNWLDGHSDAVSSGAGIEILEGVQRGLHALRVAFDGPCSIEHSSAAWAIVLWQLGDREEWRQLVDVEGLLARVEAAPHSDMLNDLFAYARAMAA
jgi:hypothetical protein